MLSPAQIPVCLRPRPFGSCLTPAVGVGRLRDGAGWSLVGSAVFKTVVGREERPGCVRFAHGSAISTPPGGSRGFVDEGDFMRSRSFALLAVLVVVLLALSGCAAAKQALAPKTKVVTREGKVATADAKVTGELPAELPDGLPLWPGAKVRDAAVTDGSVELQLAATESFKDVVAGVGVGFERAKWNVVESLSDDTNTVLEVSNADYEGVVTLTAGEDVGTTIEYVLAPVQ